MLAAAPCLLWTWDVLGVQRMCDMGAWKWNGSYRGWCAIDAFGDVEMLGKTPGRSSHPCYQIWRREKVDSAFGR